jgi:hypothetical protein
MADNSPIKVGSYVTIRCQVRRNDGNEPCKGSTAILIAKVQPSDIALQATITASFQCCTCKGVFTISH